MELYFRQAGGAKTALRALSSANGTDAKVQADLLVGIAGANAATYLGPLLENRRALFIASDGGANALRSSERNPFIFHNTLGYWQANAAMGQWAAQHLGRKAFVASSFYESGYDTLYTFCRGLETAGGQVLQTYVAHVPPDENDLPELIAAIQRARPDFVYALFSGSRAVDFVRAYADSGLASHIPLAGSAFIVDETLLPQLGNAALGIRSGLSWAPTLPTAENRAFIAAFQATNGRAPDAFAVLGYDTARWIAQALETVVGDLAQTDRLREAFLAASFAGPRGLFRMDPDTQTAVTPLYLREVQPCHGTLVNQVVGELEPVSENADWLAALPTEMRTGWIHAYLGV
jgi:branched-chain amino acid transport system substrate-binding protein